MTQAIADATLAARVRQAGDVLEIVDESGATLGFFHPVTSQGAAARSPYSNEELKELRRQRTGKPLADILKRLGAQ